MGERALSSLLRTNALPVLPASVSPHLHSSILRRSQVDRSKPLGNLYERPEYQVYPFNLINNSPSYFTYVYLLARARIEKFLNVFAWALKVVDQEVWGKKARGAGVDHSG